MKTFDIFANERLITSDLFVIDLPQINIETKTYDVFVGDRKTQMDLFIDKLPSQDEVPIKTFDMFIGEHKVSCELFITELPVRDTLSIVYKMVIDAQVDDVIAEKTLSYDEKYGTIVVYAQTDIASIKNITSAQSTVGIGASVDVTSEDRIYLDEIKLIMTQAVKMAMQKFTESYSTIEVGVNDEMQIMPLKSLGKPSFEMDIDVSANEQKTAYVVFDNEVSLSSNAQESAIFYISYEEPMVVCADIVSLSFLKNLLDIESGTEIDAEVLSVDINGSFGKITSQIEQSVEVQAHPTKLLHTETQMVLTVEADESLTNYVSVNDGVALTCSVDLSMMRTRTLAEVDAFGALANIDAMTLEEVSYVTIE